MEIKIRIPKLFPKYRVLKQGNCFYAEKKSGGEWRRLDKSGRAWYHYKDEYGTKFNTLEDAVKFIQDTKQVVVWKG